MMDGIQSFTVAVLELGMVLASLLVALVMGAVGLVVISLLVARPARPGDPIRRGRLDHPDVLDHIRIPGHSAEPVAVRPPASIAVPDRVRLHCCTPGQRVR
jgi:hypothetical protein